MTDLRVVPYKPLQDGQPVDPFAAPGESQEPTRGPSTSVQTASQGFSTSPTITCSITNSAAGRPRESDSVALIDSYLCSLPLTEGSPSFRASNLIAQAGSQAPFEQQSEKEEPINSPGQYLEHHGPWSWLSVCSQPGIRWVCDMTHSEDFIEVANDLTKALSRRLRLKLDQVKSRCSDEPDEDVAWRYVNAYFDKCYDSIFGIVHRPTFEARLRHHFSSAKQGHHAEEDVAWYALRNIIYAAGCRCALAECSTVSFVEAQAEAFRFFQNALSVYVELTFTYTGLTAVRVLTLMSFYAEGIGCPALDYPLCANATQAALTKGLHREPSQSSGLTEVEIISRNWLWWTIYCLEKQLAFRSGRPSLIEDDNISAKIPTVPMAGTTMDIEAIRNLISHAQISAQISSRIMSIQAFKKPASETVRTIRGIEEQLQSLLCSLPPRLRMPCSSNTEFSEATPRIGAYYLHCAIHGSLMATHMSLFYPWMSLRFEKETDPDYHNLLTTSAETIAHSARQIILILRSVNVNIATPAWLCFYYPMYAHINLFVYILKHPQSRLAQSDLSMLDICAGHFGYLDRVSLSTIAFHFPRDSVALAAKTVRANRSKTSSEPSRAGLAALGIETGAASSPAQLHDSMADSEDPIHLPSAEVASWPEIDLDLDVWNIFTEFDDAPSLEDTLV